MGGMSWWHWVVIAGAFVLLFGAKKLPDAARGLGRSMRILKSEVGALNEDPDAKAAGPEPAATGLPAVEPAAGQARRAAVPAAGDPVARPPAGTR